MSNIQDIISKALALWSEKHAESTVRCQGIYFSALFKAAEEGGFDSPCQELYDIFLKGAKPRPHILTVPSCKSGGPDCRHTRYKQRRQLLQ